MKPCHNITPHGKLSFTGVVSVTLSFHRNVNDVANKGNVGRSEASGIRL